MVQELSPNKSQEGLSRRDFLGIAVKVAALWGLSSTVVPKLAQAVEALATGQAPVLWLEGMNCAGCSVSLLNSYPTTPLSLLTKSISLKFNQTISTVQGQQAVDLINTTIATGGYILVVEGAVPAGLPEACRVGGENFGDHLVRAAARADKVLAVGACACFGGIPASPNNPTGATDAISYLASKGISKPSIRIPGCPPHPDWIVGTITYLLQSGMPPLDSSLRPLQFFGKTLHSQCPRRDGFEEVDYLGQVGCYKEMGCRGPRTYCDCVVRHWNSTTNDCIISGGMCIGCTQPNFSKDGAFFTGQRGGGGTTATMSWVGNVSQFPVSAQLKSTDNLWINIETSPAGSTYEGSVVYSVNGGTWKSTRLSLAGMKGSNDWWNLNMGKFAKGTQIKYAIQMIGRSGNSIWANNNGADYLATVTA